MMKISEIVTDFKVTNHPFSDSDKRELEILGNEISILVKHAGNRISIKTEDFKRYINLLHTFKINIGFEECLGILRKIEKESEAKE